MGLDSSLNYMESCCSRSSVEGFLWNLLPHSIHQPLSVHGVDGCDYRRYIGCQNANTWFALVDCGGLSYTVGVVFFAIDSRLQYAHLIWHLFVLTGTTCHYFAVLWYAA